MSSYDYKRAKTIAFYDAASSSYETRCYGQITSRHYHHILAHLPVLDSISAAAPAPCSGPSPIRMAL